MEEGYQIGDVGEVVRAGSVEGAREGQVRFREEKVEGIFEALVPIMGEKEIAGRDHQVAVTAEPEGVAAVEGEGERGGHVVGADAGNPFDNGKEALIIIGLAVAVDVVADLSQVE